MSCSFEDLRDHFIDVYLNVGESKIPASKIILASRSQVFRKMFLSGMKETFSQEITIGEIKEIEIFKHFINSLYSDNINKKIDELGNTPAKLYFYKLCHVYQVEVDYSKLLKYSNIDKDTFGMYYDIIRDIFGINSETLNRLATVSIPYFEEKISQIGNEEHKREIINRLGPKIIVTTMMGEIIIYNQLMKQALEIDNFLNNPIFSVAMINTGRRIIIPFRNEIKFYNAISGAASSFNIRDTDKDIYSIAVFHDEQFIVSGSGSGSGNIKIWDAQNGALIKTFSKKGANRIINDLCLSSDDKTLIAVDKNMNSFDIWDIENGKLLGSYYHNSILKVLYSPDDKFFASQNSAGIIKIWDARERKELYTINSDSKKYSSYPHRHDFCFSQNGDRIFTTFDNHIIRSWNLSSGGKEYEEYSFDHQPERLFLRNDGKVIMLDYMGNLWILNPEEFLARLEFSGDIVALYGYASQDIQKSLII